MNNKIQKGCGIAGAVFIALGFIMRFVSSVFEFISADSYYSPHNFMYATFSLFVFVIAVIAFAFAIVALTRNGDKAIVSEILIAVCFFTVLYNMFYTAYSFCAAALIAIAAILYSIYFASVVNAQQQQFKAVQPDVEVSFEEKADKLVGYKRMLDEGLLSEEEFAAIKQRVLGE